MRIEVASTISELQTESSTVTNVVTDQQTGKQTAFIYFLRRVNQAAPNATQPNWQLLVLGEEQHFDAAHNDPLQAETFLIDRGFEVLHVEKRRCGDLDEIDILATGQLLEGVRPVKHELLIDGSAAQVGIHLVEMILAGGKLIGEEISERDHLRGGVLRKRSGHRSAATPAAGAKN